PADDVAPNSAAGLLAALRRRVAEGRGLAEAGYEEQVRDVAEVLWPADGSAEIRAPAQVHMQVAAIASEVGGWLAATADARAEYEQTHPTDVGLHDAFLAAAGNGPEAYAAWCAGAGRAQLEAHADARRKRFFGPR
ncbi:MAG: hypothetical protein O2894_13930, partial [Planctomycetota bacterium]|nr:hypothetical protein [Planctomycetota bacterium]